MVILCFTALLVQWMYTLFPKFRDTAVCYSGPLINTQEQINTYTPCTFVWDSFESNLVG